MIDWTAELEEAICERLIQGESLHSFAGTGDFPAESTIYLRILKSKEFSEKYARAREAQMELMAAQIVDIAEENPMTTIPGKHGDYEAVDSAAIQRNRLRVDTRKWLMSKLAPKKYGDRTVLAGDPENPLAIGLASRISEARKRDK